MSDYVNLVRLKLTKFIFNYSRWINYSLCFTPFGRELCYALNDVILELITTINLYI